MAELMRLRAFAVRQSLTYLGGLPAAKAYDWLSAYCSDPNQLLPKAIERSTEQTWQALAMALDDQPSLGDRLKHQFAPGVVKGMAAPLRVLIAERDTEFRRRCREELARLRLDGTVDAEWRQAVVDCPAFTTPTEALEHSRTVMADEAALLRDAGFPHLSELIELELPNGGGSLLLHVFNSFLRATVADNPELSQFLSFNLLEQLSDQQSYALELLEEIRQCLPDEAKTELIVPPGATAILRSLDDERTFQDLLARLEALPEAQRSPELVDNLGRLGMAVGQYPQAQRLFTTSAVRQSESHAQAEAHYNAYRAALEHHDWTAAKIALKHAAALDPERFEPFPLRKYRIDAILGAGGFGTAFRCHDEHLDTQVVIKTLHQAALERDTRSIFREARILQRLNHPAIVTITHCDFADQEETRPYIVMGYFDGIALDDYLTQHGRLDTATARQLAQKIAHGMQAAHAQNILHRDLKPANILVRKTADNWDIRIIDFGLAMKVQQIRESVLAAKLTGSLLADSAGGTSQYAAPEQMGLLQGSVGSYSDVYGFGKTLCYCLFLKTNPTRLDWRRLDKHDEALSALLSDCIEDHPTERPEHFTAVLKALAEPDAEAEQRRQAQQPAKQRHQDEESFALVAGRYHMRGNQLNEKQNIFRSQSEKVKTSKANQNNSKTTTWTFAILIVVVMFFLVYVLVEQEPSTNQRTESTLSSANFIENCHNPVDWHDAHKLIGERAAVWGAVAGIVYRPDLGGQPTWINIGADFPNNNRLVLVLWGRNRSVFDTQLRYLSVGDDICVVGKISEYRGIVQIELENVAQLSIL